MSSSPQVILTILFKFGILILDFALRNTLGDVLLAAPIIVAVHLGGFLALAGAHTFTDYIYVLCAQLAMTAVTRMYLEPAVKAIGVRLPLILMRLQRTVSAYRRKTREARLAEEQQWRRIQDDVALASEGVEPLLESTMQFSTEALALLLQPALLLALYILDASPLHGLQITQIPAHQGIEPMDLVYYCALAVVIIPFHLASDASLLHAQVRSEGWDCPLFL